MVAKHVRDRLLVILCSLEEIPEMIDHKRNGYMADFKSSADLAKGMLWILNSESYDTLSRETRESAERRYSKMKAVDAHIQLYKSLVGKTDSI